MKLRSLFFVLLSLPFVGSATTISDIAQKLRGLGCYADSCSYEVLLPQFSEPVVYDLTLESSGVNPGDTLAECNYLISWILHTPMGQSEGFSAYFGGSHFRYRDQRLQEYHAEQNPEPFSPEGHRERGVQNQAQFVDLLPQYIAARFEQMLSDTSYTYNIKETAKSVVVNGKRRLNGYEASEFTYTFAPETLLPVRIEFENNPGQLSEQSITVKYSAHPVLGGDCALNLATLAERKSEAFEKYRENSFSLDKLPGMALPEFSAPTLAGNRYSHDRGGSFDTPVVLAFLDASVGSTPEVIAAVRRAVDFLPMNSQVLWAFLNRRADDVADVIGNERPAETTLINARSAARACGVGALTPVLIFIGTDGRVSEVLNGFNQNLESIVIQNVSLLAN